MFERGVCHLDNRFIGSQAVRFNDDRAAFALGCVQCRSELIECDFLIPEINPGFKMKFELSNKKKTRRKTTSSSGKRTSQPKLYSFVRLSFMRALK
jgi:hypothetical protein